MPLLVLLTLFFIGRHWYYDVDRYPRLELLTESVSPHHKYAILAYSTEFRSTTSLSVLCELRYNDESKEPKTIYFESDQERINIVWRSNTEVEINGQVLTMPNDVYLPH
ncbi:hypothetical protein D3C77_433350 [compost metagenome]